MKDPNPRRRKRRTCYDRAWKRWLDARRARTTNPASSAVMQLLGIFGVLLGRVPTVAPMPAPQRYVAPPMSPRRAQKNDVARHLGVPTRYLDIVLAKGRVPYALLSEHIRLGGATRRDALDELRTRIPAGALDWFNDIVKRGLWSELSLCFRQDGNEEDTNIRFLQATLSWAERQRKPGDAPLGPAEADRNLTPSSTREIEDPDDDPLKPKP